MCITYILKRSNNLCFFLTQERIVLEHIPPLNNTENHFVSFREEFYFPPEKQGKPPLLDSAPNRKSRSNILMMVMPGGWADSQLIQEWIYLEKEIHLRLIPRQIHLFNLNFFIKLYFVFDKLIPIFDMIKRCSLVYIITGQY